MDKIIIKIADDYTKTPGVRDDIEGDFPGEDFLNKILLPRFKEALADKKKLLVDLDDTTGYAISFLQSSFGALAREYKDPKLVLKNLEFKSYDNPFLIEDIQECIKEANKKWQDTL